MPPFNQERFRNDPEYQKAWASKVTNALLDDSVFYAENVLKIKDKRGHIVPFIPNEEQRFLMRTVDKMRKSGKAVRIVVLKPRQIGISTACEGLVFKSVTLRPNIAGKVIAHDQDSTENLLRMSQLMFDYLPRDLKPMVRYTTRKEMLFENPREVARGKNPGLRSRLSVATAGRATAGRSETFQLAHLSEVAFWENAAEVVTGLLQSIPDNDPNTMIIMESTANGVGNYFYDIYTGAEAGKNDFVAIFFPWFQFEEYRDKLSPVHEKWLREDLNQEELELIKRFKLTLGHISWRRKKINQLSMLEGTSPEALFRQEYPSTAEEAFIVKGKTAFDPDALMKNTPRKPLEVRRVVDDSIWDKKFTWKGRFVPKMIGHPHGEFKIFEKPIPGHQYMVSGDVAQGERGNDFSCIEVIDKKTFEQVAEWHGKIDTDVFARIAVMIATWYNNADVALESTGIGQGANITLRDTAYPFVYVPQTYGKQIDVPVDRFGFYTSVGTKPSMIVNMQTFIRQGILGINSQGLWRECLEFRQNEKGQFEAPEGKNDDRVMAMAIGLMAINEYPYIERAVDDVIAARSELEQGASMLEAPREEYEDSGAIV